MRPRPRRFARRVARDVSETIGTVRDVFEGWLFNNRIVARALRREHVLGLGDSHVRILRHVKVRGVWFRARPLSGATASGVLNPHSTTRSLETFLADLARAKPWQQIVFQLGEVDCGFVIWYRAAKYGHSVDDQLAETISTYAALLADVAHMGFRRVIVLSAPLPTIGDYPSEFATVAGQRKEVTASMSERTELTLRFNDALRDRCDELGVAFVDVTTGHLDPVTGLVDQRFVRETDVDHHLADKPYSELLARQLGWLGQR
jgi:hypothetical protein